MSDNEILDYETREMARRIGRLPTIARVAIDAIVLAFERETTRPTEIKPLIEYLLEHGDRKFVETLRAVVHDRLKTF